MLQKESIRNDPEDEIQSLEIDEPEDLQITFDIEAETQFNTTLQKFLRNQTFYKKKIFFSLFI